MPFLTGAFNQHLRLLNQACVLPPLSENVDCQMTKSVSELVPRWREPPSTDIWHGRSIYAHAKKTELFVSNYKHLKPHNIDLRVVL